MKRILLANDLTERSVDALARALRLAAHDEAALRIVHVAREGAAMDLRLFHQAESVARNVVDTRMEISVRTLSGETDDAIAAAVREFDADLVVLGSHGLPHLRDALFGTTAMHLARTVTCPILIAQISADVPYRKALVAVDEPVTAAPILRHAVEIAPDAELVTVHAFRPTFTETMRHALSGDAAAREQQLAIRQILRDTCSETVARRCRVLVREGDTMEVLMDSWAEIEPDLVAIATRGHSLIRGSLTQAVLLGCTSDILVARSGGEGGRE